MVTLRNIGQIKNLDCTGSWLCEAGYVLANEPNFSMPSVAGGMLPKTVSMQM